MFKCEERWKNNKPVKFDSLYLFIFKAFTQCRNAGCRHQQSAKFGYFHLSIFFKNKDSARWEKSKTNLFDFAFPNRSLSYQKIVQGERKEKSLLNFLFRIAAYLVESISKCIISERTWRIYLLACQSQFFPWSTVELLLNFHNSSVWEVGKIGFLRDVLPDKLVGVLNCALLPRAVGVSKIYLSTLFHRGFKGGANAVLLQGNRIWFCHVARRMQQCFCRG